MSQRLFEQPPGGMLVTVDGPNGSGKTSLAKELAVALGVGGEVVHATCQPSPTRLGETVRNAEPDLRGRALACLVAGDRHHQCATEFAEHLSAGSIVLCDRYVESSLVLQRLDEVDLDFILAINAGIPRPDLRFRLTAAPDTLRGRLAARTRDPHRRFEQSGGPERELELYETADSLLSNEYGVPSILYDTSDTQAPALAELAAGEVFERRSRSPK